MSAIELLYQTAGELAVSRLLIINAHAHDLLSGLSEQADRSDRSHLSEQTDLGPKLSNAQQTKIHGLQLYQHFKPAHESIRQMGLHVSASLTDLDGLYDLILLLPSKNKQQNMGWMATAMQKLCNDGRLIIACENKHGAKSYQSALQALAGNISSRCKSKCRIFSARKTTALDTILCKQWLDTAQANTCESHGFISQPGLFSWNHADTGSQLLIHHLPVNLSGTGMDLCCGYGFLAAHILRTSPEINTLHLLEADAIALDCAQRNTAAWQHKCHRHWLDASSDKLPEKLDWVVCNPPFHSGQTQDIELGKTIIQRACHSLKRGGVLYVVANRKLPYEALMRSALSRRETLVETNGFKVIKGVR